MSSSSYLLAPRAVGSSTSSVELGGHALRLCLDCWEHASRARHAQPWQVSQADGQLTVMQVGVASCALLRGRGIFDTRLADSRLRPSLAQSCHHPRMENATGAARAHRASGGLGFGKLMCPATWSPASGLGLSGWIFWDSHIAHAHRWDFWAFLSPSGRDGSPCSL